MDYCDTVIIQSYCEVIYIPNPMGTVAFKARPLDVQTSQVGCLYSILRLQILF